MGASVALKDPVNDLVLLRPENPSLLPPGLPFSSTEPSSGTPVFTIGFPHPDFMGIEAKLTDGIISARSGLGGDPRAFQISVPVQAGNSGGPLMNMAGEVVGIVVSKLDAGRVFKLTGDLPENVNYAIKLAYLRPLVTTARPLRGAASVPAGAASLPALVARVRDSVVLVAAQ